MKEEEPVPMQEEKEFAPMKKENRAPAAVLEGKSSGSVSSKACKKRSRQLLPPGWEWIPEPVRKFLRILSLRSSSLGTSFLA